MLRSLVIEDNQTSLQLMSYLLHAFGHLVIQATDGESGVQAAQREKPDLIAIDVARRGHPPLLDEPECVTAIDAFLSRLP